MKVEKTLDLAKYKRHLQNISGPYHFTVPSGQMWEILLRAMEAEEELERIKNGKTKTT